MGTSGLLHVAVARPGPPGAEPEADAAEASGDEPMRREASGDSIMNPQHPGIAIKNCWDLVMNKKHRWKLKTRLEWS